MTPTEITDQARQITNKVGSTFVSDTELIGYLNNALQEASQRSRAYETIDVVTSVVSQATYVLTTSIDEIKQVLYDGLKVRSVTFREAGASTYFSPSTSAIGTPESYYVWGGNMVFTPMPGDAGKNITIYSYSLHPTVTQASTILFPPNYHHFMVDYVVFRILQKEQNPNSTNYFQLWQENLKVMRSDGFEKNRSDSFRQVQQEEVLVYGVWGAQ